MNLRDIKAIAKKKGVKELNLKKGELIRTIQRAEGNFDCYGSAAGGRCDRVDCLWREDCMVLSAA